MYKTSTFIASIFYKLKVHDPAIRKQIRILYTPIIDTILQNVSQEHRVVIFKFLLPTIKSSVLYLKMGGHPEGIEALTSSIRFSEALINKIGLASASSTFDDIMKQVNIDETACEIGVCIRILRGDCTDKEKEDAKCHLELLLKDYNDITGQSLSLSSVMPKPESIDHEL